MASEGLVVAVNNLSFSAQVDDWVKATERRMTAVFRESTQRMASIAANGVPIDTGFARASVRASLAEMPSIVPGSKGREGQAYPSSFGQVTATIANAQLGQTVYVGWTASYILALEYGHSKQAPAGFVRLAAAQWPRIVEVVTQEAKSRAA
jgi:hypothetical protein